MQTWAVGRALARPDCPLVLCLNDQTVLLTPEEAREIAQALVHFAGRVETEQKTDG